jgi:hypothetical protein
MKKVWVVYFSCLDCSWRVPKPGPLRGFDEQQPAVAAPQSQGRYDSNSDRSVLTESIPSRASRNLLDREPVLVQREGMFPTARIESAEEATPARTPAVPNDQAPPRHPKCDRIVDQLERLSCPPRSPLHKTAASMRPRGRR